MKNNEKHKAANRGIAASAETPQQHTAPATLNDSATPTTSAAPPIAAAPTVSAAFVETSQSEAAKAQTESAGNAEGKIPPLDLGEDRLTPITAPIVRVDNPDATSVADKVAVPKTDVSAVIKAIVTAMDIDTRLAHALVDIHTGVDAAEAFGRAYGITLPTGKGEAVPDVRPKRAARSEAPEGDAPGAVDTSVARLPEQVASVPTFLCNPRRGFWD